MNSRATCTICKNNEAIPFFRVEDVPVSCNHLCSEREEATSQPRAVISLAFCAGCGHVFNFEFDADRLNYTNGYENSLAGSHRFREYDQSLIAALLERYQLSGRLIMEVGCGRGEFLRALCEQGGNSGVGFDPSYRSEAHVAVEPFSMVIYPEVYGSQNRQLDAEFICSRHTLEHVWNPREFLSDVRDATPQRGVPVFFEVPNGLYVLRDKGIWDIIYEHCSYFTPGSLARVFWEAGYEEVEVEETFARQFLTVHAKTGTWRKPAGCGVAAELTRLVQSFAEIHRAKLKHWTSRLLTLERRHRKTVVWGAGAKAATFLNLLRPQTIEYVVDVNSRKHGRYVAGTGQQIVPAAFLCAYEPDDIICMNPNYVEEIACQIRSLGLHASLLCA